MMKRLNYLDDYSVKTADVDQELENYRIERDVAIAAIGRPSLTAVPTETPAEQRQRLIKLREHAVSKLHRMDRGRRDWAFGLKTGDLATGAGRASGARADCDEGDEKLGLCGGSSLSPRTAEMSDEEKKVEEELTKKEKQHDAMRAKMEAEINSRRLQRAKELMDKLSKTDSLINELVHHTVKVSQMPSHMPQTTD
jgi:hypothetical protein